MSWVDIGERAALNEGNTTRGYAHFQYDDSSTGTSRPCRIVIEKNGSNTFNVMFRDITVDGYNYGTVTGVTQNWSGENGNPAVWTGTLSGDRNVTASWTNPWYAGTKYPSITGYLPVGGSAPEWPYVTFDECRWDYIKATSGVSSWGGLSGSNHFAVITGNSNGDAANISSFSGARREYNFDGSWDTSHQFTARTNNTSATYDGQPLEIKGLLAYKLGVWVGNSAGSAMAFDNTLRHLPPAPGQLSYSLAPGLGSSVDATISYTGVSANNHTGYDASELKRTVRYYNPDLVIPGVDPVYTYIINDGVAALTDVTSDTVTILAQESIVVEAWMTYYGWKSETSTVTIVNSNDPVDIYASVEGDSKVVDKIYGSIDNLTVPVVKVYGSVEGVARKVFEDNSV